MPVLWELSPYGRYFADSFWYQVGETELGVSRMSLESRIGKLEEIRPAMVGRREVHFTSSMACAEADYCGRSLDGNSPRIPTDSPKLNACYIPDHGAQCGYMASPMAERYIFIRLYIGFCGCLYAM